jgi:hypothetical protein
MTESTPSMPFLGDKNDTLPSFLDETPADRGMGNENVGSGDQDIPRISLLQNSSNQLRELDDAKAGQFHNSVTNELLETMVVVNLFYEKEWAIWRDQDLGGGFKGAFDSLEAAEAEISALPGNEADYKISETAKHACLLIDPETGVAKQPVMIYLKSSGLSASRNWNSQINAFNGDHPRFASLWLVSAGESSNKKGTWASWKFSSLGWVPNAETYDTAKKFYEAVSSK